MLERVIDWSVKNRFLVIILTCFVVAAGYLSVRSIPLEAIPDLSDVQVIVETSFPGQAPQIVEDQVTYPLATEMLKVPGATTVRGFSFFETSFVYVLFADGTDPYWARSRVLEYLTSIRSRLPETAQPSLGPDATGLGWVYQYVLEDTSHTYSLADLRSIQDWTLRYQLNAVPGVSEVASVGGFERMYEVTVDPVKLRAYGIPVTRVMEAIRSSNQDVGAMVMELAEREFMVRGLGYLRSLNDIERVVVSANDEGTPVRVADVADVRLAPRARRGVADLDGRGDVVAGIVIMRFGENALATIDRVKARLKELEAGLPPGLVIHPVYDRSGLIHRSIATLREKLLEESLVVALVCALFLFHVRSALVAIITLPLGILMAFIAMRALGIGADIMSLGGIAIAIGTMVDASIVMVENLHKHFERLGEERTRALTTEERWAVVAQASKEVGPALFFSLLVITASFLPVFALEAQEGRLFKPLAWTKSLSMASAALLSVTVVPVAMGYLVRGRIRPEEENPIQRVLIRMYMPILRNALRIRWLIVGGAMAAVILTWIPLNRIGSEFMPPLDEGSILYMPTTLPGIGVTTALRALSRQDSILASFPEVATVFGKAGRAGTATDPAPLEMFETTITLRPASEWREGMTYRRLVAAMDSAVQYPGITNSWTMPIKGRIDMLATGIRTPVGVKIFGPDLEILDRLGREVEGAVKMVAGTRSAFADRVVSGSYLDIQIDRDAAARYGLSVADIQRVITSAIGGMSITETVEGRERYGVRVRYPQELRDQPEKLADVLIPLPPRRPSGQTTVASNEPAMGSDAPGSGDMASAMAAGGQRGGAQIPLGQVATINTTRGPMGIKTEGAFPTAWVYIDVVDRDLGSYVSDARAMVDRTVTLPPGYRLEWSGQYAFMQRARDRLQIVVPATLMIIFVLLYLSFGRVEEALMVMLSLPFALVGGVLFLWILDFNWSVATGIGFIALAGVSAETGVIMLLYLDQSWRERVKQGRTSMSDLTDAILEGAVLRLRPKMMTVATIIVGLLPIFWGNGAGASVMRRIAAPMVGGMVSALVLTLVVIPVVYSLWKEREVRPAEASVSPRDPVPFGD